jgi:hypothetical protein
MRLARLARCLCLLASVASAGTTPAPTSGDMTSHLRSQLLEAAWRLEVRAGPIHIESRTLQFFSSGSLIERIYDDTGRHDLSGTWRLIDSPTSPTLVLEGSQLRDRGHFIVTASTSLEALSLQPAVGGAPLLFTRTPRFPDSTPGVGPSATPPHR